MFNITHFLS